MDSLCKGIEIVLGITCMKNHEIQQFLGRLLMSADSSKHGTLRKDLDIRGTQKRTG